MMVTPEAARSVAARENLLRNLSAAQIAIVAEWFEAKAESIATISGPNSESAALFSKLEAQHLREMAATRDAVVAGLNGGP